MSNNLVIAIGREFGSGGREIAQKVAEQLGIPLYDKELISMMAKDIGISEAVLSDVDEAPVNSLLYALSAGGLNGSMLVTGVADLPIADQAFIACSRIIRNLAEKGSCVILGRCADSILADHEKLLTVFIHADLEQRIDRICEYEKISRSDAAGVIKRADKKRAGYHNYYADTKWGSRSAYDLCINSRIGVDAAACIICDAAHSLNG